MRAAGERVREPLRIAPPLQQCGRSEGADGCVLLEQATHVAGWPGSSPYLSVADLQEMWPASGARVNEPWAMLNAHQAGWRSHRENPCLATALRPGALRRRGNASDRWLRRQVPALARSAASLRVCNADAACVRSWSMGGVSAAPPSLRQSKSCRDRATNRVAQFTRIEVRPRA